MAEIILRVVAQWAWLRPVSGQACASRHDRQVAHALQCMAALRRNTAAKLAAIRRGDEDWHRRWLLTNKGTEHG